jgi:hypothetical protein
MKRRGYDEENGLIIRNHSPHKEESLGRGVEVGKRRRRSFD